jgi:hypothetical protein
LVFFATSGAVALTRVQRGKKETPNTGRWQMNEELLDAVVDFVEHFELVFDADWEVTQANIRNSEFLISERGTFVEPGVEDEANNWGNRGSLLDSYRHLRALLDELGRGGPPPNARGTESSRGAAGLELGSSPPRPAASAPPRRFEGPAVTRVHPQEIVQGNYIMPPEPVYGPNEPGWRWYRETTAQSCFRTGGVTYITRTVRDKILYVGSGGWHRPFARHHSNRGGTTDVCGYGFSSPDDRRVMEVLAISPSRWYAEILESLICEIAQPPLNAKWRMLPPDRHLSERDEAVAFWNRNYASRFGVRAPWPYSWGESAGQDGTPGT